jgi:hypothetical protein
MWVYGDELVLRLVDGSYCGEKTEVRLVALACRGSCGVVGFTA